MTGEPPNTPGPAAGGTIELKGAQVTDQRLLGPLGGVLIVTRPDGIPPEAWCGCDRIVLRVLRAEEDESDDSVARLREDAARLVGVEHPNLLRVLGFANHKNEEFVALECPSGETLQSMVARREPPPDEALDVARNVAAALGELARRGGPLRDFGTSAVFVAKGGRTKVVPLACPREYTVEPKASPGGSYRGGPLYAAPELHDAGGGQPTERSNIFAFGVAFYEMLAFQPPFRGGTPTRLLLDVAGSEPRAPSTVVVGVPTEIDRICLRCLEKDPERRFPTFAAIEATLRIAAESVVLGGPATAGGAQSTREMATAASAPTSAMSSASQAPSARRMSASQKGLLAAAGAVVVAGVALVAIILFGVRGPGRQPESVANDVFVQVEKMMDSGAYGKAMRLLESHQTSIRGVDAAKFDELHRSACAAHWTKTGETAEGEGRWKDAVGAFEKALAMSGGAEGAALRSRIEKSLYHAEISRAEEAEGANEWRVAVAALEKALSLGQRLGLSESELGPVRANMEFAKVMTDARSAKGAGDAEAERKRLLEAARLRPGQRAVLKALETLGAGPKASEAALARARAALDAGELSEAERLAKEAADLWPSAKSPGQVLTYLADRASCELDDGVFVSPQGPWDSWGPDERAKAFCIDPYEFRSEGDRLPQTLVSGLEAMAACRKRGARLCRTAEWQLACAGSESRVFPYGNEYRFDACNTAGSGAAAPGFAPDCRSPFGAYDMSGNVAEWTADYVRGKGQVVAGGDWSSGETGSSCTAVIYFEPKLASPRVGFRCCRSIVEPSGDERAQ